MYEEYGPKTSGTHRILALGDSWIYGVIVNDDETLLFSDPDSIGSGEAIVVASGTVLERLAEGDRVAVLGRLGGTDFVVGSMIVCAEEILVLKRAGVPAG